MAGRSYAIEQRLRFIDFLVHQYGHVNRSALMDYYGVSMPQASEDIRQYRELAPHNLEYDGSAKTYRQSYCFVRVWP